MFSVFNSIRHSENILCFAKQGRRKDVNIALSVSVKVSKYNLRNNTLFFLSLFRKEMY